MVGPRSGCRARRFAGWVEVFGGRSVTIRATALAVLVGAATVLGGCGGDDASIAPKRSASTSSVTIDPTLGRLVVTQVQLDCCYTEGQVSSIVIRDAAKAVVAEHSDQPDETSVVLLDEQLAPGAYEVESYQRPCVGNCEHLDPPTDLCTEPVELVAGAELHLTVTFSPGRGCSISRSTS